MLRLSIAIAKMIASIVVIYIVFNILQALGIFALLRGLFSLFFPVFEAFLPVVLIGLAGGFVYGAVKALAYWLGRETQRKLDGSGIEDDTGLYCFKADNVENRFKRDSMNDSVEYSGIIQESELIEKTGGRVINPETAVVYQKEAFVPMVKYQGEELMTPVWQAIVELSMVNCEYCKETFDRFASRTVKISTELYQVVRNRLPGVREVPIGDFIVYDITTPALTVVCPNCQYSDETRLPAQNIRIAFPYRHGERPI